MSLDGKYMIEKQTREIISHSSYKSYLMKDLLRGLKGEFKLASIFKANENTSDYEVGSWDVRSWGYYVVTNVKKTSDIVTECQKDICVFPKQMLSLQSHMGEDMDGNDLGHKGRKEIWRVVEGTLTYIQNGELKTAEPGDEITHGPGVIHCMINMTDKPVKVHEIQSGVCQELDNIRLMDFGGRKVKKIEHPKLQASKKLYQSVMDAMPQSLSKYIANAQNTVRMWTSRAMFLANKPTG